MKKKLIAIGIVVLFVAVLYLGLGGKLPIGQLLDNGTTTISHSYEEVQGNRGSELIGPRERKGFICSYIDTEWSETISVQGRICDKNDADCTYWWSAPSKCKYIVYLKENQFSSYVVASQPGSTSQYISVANPGEIVPDCTYVSVYEFEIRGNKYSNGAVKVELWAFFDNTMYDDKGQTWYKVSQDEAYLYSGWGGLYLPKDSEGRFISTFEIGEEAKIGVKTSYGAMMSDSENKWKVSLKYPASRGGAEYLSKYYQDNADTYFTFIVTADMFVIGGDNTWRLEIYNTLVPKGTLYVDTIDLKAKAPGDVDFSNYQIQYKANNQISITLTTTVNAQTQLPIKFFKVAVIYGTGDVLLPSNPTDPQYILPWAETPQPTKENDKYVYTITFTPKYKSYVTIHAKAYDTDGRASLHTRYVTLWIYEENPSNENPPDTGEGDYGGGHTNPWSPWEPDDDDPTQYHLNPLFIKLIEAIIVFIIFFVIACIPQFKIPGGLIGRIVLIVIGGIIAFLVYSFF